MIRRATLCLLSVVGLVVTLAGPAAATPGVLDTTFGSAGTGLVRTDMSPRGDTPWGMAIQSDDKIVVVGTGGGPNSKFAVARYNADGTLDKSFGGGDGKILTDIGPYKDEAVSVVIESDNDIVVAGGAGLNGPDAKFAVVRYLSDGTPDPSFGGGDGIETIDVSKYYDLATGVGILSNGDILVAGGAAEDRNNSDFAAVALKDSDGSLDTSFGGTGIVRTDISGHSYDAGNSNVVVNGSVSYIGGLTFPAGSANGRFAVVSYNNDGSPNTTFGGAGNVTTNFTGGLDYVSGLALSGSDVVAVGEAGYQTSTDEAALAEYTSAGILDSGFGGTGKVVTNYGPFGDVASSVAVDGSGNIVTAGGIGLGGPNPKFAVCRYLSNGTPDPAFGSGGRVSTDFGPYGDVADAVGIQSPLQSSRIVAAGVIGSGGGNSEFGLAGYQSS